MGSLDVSLKHMITECPSHWAEWLGVQTGLPVRVVDSDVAALAQVADKVLLIDAAPPFILHLEPHSYYDEWLDYRVYGYNGALTRRHRMFVHTVVVALHPKAWGPGNSGRIQRVSPLGGCRVDFTYQVIKVWELPVDQVLEGGVGVLPLAPITDVPRPELPQVIQQMRQRFDQEVPRPLAAELWTATFMMIGLKYSRELAHQLLRGVRDIMQESDTYQAILEEGFEKGIETGRLEGKRDDLILLGTRRLGPPDAVTLAEINAVNDLKRLEAMLLRVLDASGWDEVLGGNGGD